ncbi:unnamed protein product [Darwinula stevensoni]|uniref:Uncharacterized protein n=1 Tax=Darwinula stevensoni TaxID=69355 RepID=A0A7R8XFW8_9CRUS|nr:unnamed protein product [Darwinula stevensoni]CAG0892003.1 unnamed protein product [Darwinula stevensoni]
MMPAENVIRKVENRRSNKPLMEKRRRARINNCLNELKALILDSMKKDVSFASSPFPARHSKLEKADILELTVRHVAALQQQRASLEDGSALAAKFRAGYAQCVAEVENFLERLDVHAVSPGVEPDVKHKVLNHLRLCLASVNQCPDDPQAPAATVLVPARLPSGELAFVVPAVYGRNHHDGEFQEEEEEMQHAPLNLSKVPGEEPLALTVHHHHDGRHPSSRSPSPVSYLSSPTSERTTSPASVHSDSTHNGRSSPWRPW